MKTPKNLRTIEKQIRKAIESSLPGIKRPKKGTLERLKAGRLPKAEDAKEITGLSMGLAYELVYERRIRPKLHQLKDPKKREQFLLHLKVAAPEMHKAIRKLTEELRKLVPRRGGPGRKEILTLSQKRWACQQIADLLAHDKPLPTCYEIVRHSFQGQGILISAQTLKRVWTKRGEIMNE